MFVCCGSVLCIADINNSNTYTVDVSDREQVYKTASKVSGGAAYARVLWICSV